MKKPKKNKVRPVDLLDEEAYLSEKRNQSLHHLDRGVDMAYSTGMTITYHDVIYDAEKAPRIQKKKYTQDDMDKIVMTLSLYIDDEKTRTTVDEVYQSLKDGEKFSIFAS